MHPIRETDDRDAERRKKDYLSKNVEEESMKDLVSVIVPIYNCERFLEECVESILKQKYSNLEIILVNDGSTDDSLNICLKYKKNYKNVIVINQKNKGLSEARNAGIRKATGKYIVFVDADDSIDEQEIYKCIRSIKKEKSQLVLFSYDEVYHYCKILISL